MTRAPAPPHRRRLLAAGSINMSVLAVQLVLRLTTVLILAYQLGPSGQGTVSLAAVISTIGSSIAGVGLPTAALREGATPAERPELYRIVWTHVSLVSLAGLAIAGLIVLAGSTDLALLLGVVAVAGVLVERLVASCALAEERETSFIMIAIAPALVNLIGVVALLTINRLDVTTALWAFFAANVAVPILLTLVVMRWLRPAYRADFWRSPMYALGFKLFPGDVAQITNYRFDQLLIAAWLPRDALGLYSIAVSASEVGAVPGQAAANVLLPRARRDHRIGERVVFRLASAGGAAVLITVAPFVLGVEFVLTEYHDSLTAFLVLLPAGAAMAANKILAAFIVARRDPWISSRIALWSSALIVALDLALIPAFGIVGAAAASSIVYGFATAVFVARVRGGSERDGV